MFEKENFKDVVVFQKCSVSDSFEVETYKKTIEKRLSEIKEKLFSFVEEVDVVLRNEQRILERARQDQECYWQNKQYFSDESDLNDKVKLSLKNEQSLKLFAESVESKLFEHVFDELDSKVNKMINHFVVDSLSAVRTFNGEVFRKAEHAIEKLSAAENSIGKHQVLFDFRNGDIFSFQKYFDLLEIHLSIISSASSDLKGPNF